MKIRFITCSLLLVATAPALASYKEAIGYPELMAEFGDDLPDLSGMIVGQIEFIRSGTWAPEATGELADVNFTYDPASTGAFSSHAYEVGQFFYGSESIAPGLNTVHAFRNTRWYAHIGHTRNFPPWENPWRVENHSWGGATGFTPSDLQILARVDYRVGTHNMFSSIGLDNNTGSMWPLLGNSYNGIVVGVASGNHNRGGTNLYTTGRMKPDIVVPVPFTSYSTPVVAAAASLLIAKAEEGGSLADAGQAPVVKALLMAGATKEAFPAWANSSTRPLDEVHGTGNLNIHNSYKILLSGEQAPGGEDPGRESGWDWNVTPDPAGNRLYPFTITENWDGEFSAVLAWNAEPISDTDESGNPTWITYHYNVENLPLRLWKRDHQNELEIEVSASVSEIDNVQHIYVTDLDAGPYALEVSGSAAGVPYGLAWRAFRNAETIEPSRLVAIQRVEGTLDIRLLYTGHPSAEYTIETSGDLSIWLPLGDVTAEPDGAYEYTHTDGFTGSRRFYRSILK